MTSVRKGNLTNLTSIKKAASLLDDFTNQLHQMTPKHSNLNDIRIPINKSLDKR